MRQSNTAKRLKEIMQEQHLAQKDVVELCKPICEKFNQKIDKSYISKWLSGAYEPNQIKLTILGLALNVSEAYLMGYDVPKDRKNPASEYDMTANKIRKLDLFDLGKVDSYIDDLLESEKYRKT